MSELNFNEVVKEAIKQPTLEDALTNICVWESERIVKQARENEQWETCFRVCIKETIKAWNRREHE